MYFSYRLKTAFVAPLLSVLIFGRPVGADTYKELPLSQKFRLTSGIKNFRSLKNSVLKGSADYSQNRDEFMTYYKGYLLPALTRQDQRENWDALREELISDLMIDNTNPEPRRTVLLLVWKYCNGIVPSPQFDPAVRYNYMLILGQLNLKEGTDKSPPVPLSKQVLPKLMEPFEGELAKPGTPVLRYAAMLGILRHAELTGHPKSVAPMSAAHRQQLAQLMIKVATTTDVPESVDAAANDWLRTRAVQVLGYLYLGSDDVVATLSGLLVDPNAGLAVRCEAATALGRIGQQIDSGRMEDLVGRLTRLTYDCVRAEFDILRKQAGNRNSRPGMRSSPRTWEQDPASEPTGRRQVEITDSRTTPTRRRLLFQLLAIQNGLVGNGQDIPGLLKPDEAENQVEPLRSQLQKLIAALQDVESQFEKLGAIIQVAAREELPEMVPDSLKGPARKDEEDSAERGIDDVADAGQSR